MRIRHRDTTFRLAAACVAAAALSFSWQRAATIDGNVLASAGAANGEWATYGLTYGETRFSPLTQIDIRSVNRLAPAWSAVVSDGANGQEATPLVWNGVLFGITTWSVTFALDAKTGHEIWRWDPQVDRTIAAPGTNRICCGVVNRGLALYGNRLFVPVNDGRLVALDAATGRVLWSTQATPKDDIAYSLTMAPRVVKGKVIIGNSGAEFPPYRGFFSAFDVETGREVWRFYTVPGDPSKPFENPALEAAARTWSGQWWKYGGGGSVWDAIAYDAEANLLYVGTGNPTPWPAVLRESTPDNENLYVSSILAVDPDTGALKWHFQSVPGDQWDYDATGQMTLATIRIDGRDRQVLMQAHKNGFFYVIDRRTGAFISAVPFTKVNWTTGLDPVTGRPHMNPAARYGADAIAVAPSGGGAHSWGPMAYSPSTGLAYFAAQLGTTFPYAANQNFQFTPGVMNLGLAGRGFGGPPATTPPTLGPEGQGPFLLAWDPVTQKERWRQPSGGSNGGVIATAGGLVFLSAADGRLVAHAADSGDPLYERKIGGRGMGPPITYAVDGRQYVALISSNPPTVQAFALDAQPTAAGPK